MSSYSLFCSLLLSVPTLPLFFFLIPSPPFWCVSISIAFCIFSQIFPYRLLSSIILPAPTARQQQCFVLMDCGERDSKRAHPYANSSSLSRPHTPLAAAVACGCRFATPTPCKMLFYWHQTGTGKREKNLSALAVCPNFENFFFSVTFWVTFLVLLPLSMSFFYFWKWHLLQCASRVGLTWQLACLIIRTRALGAGCWGRGGIKHKMARRRRHMAPDERTRGVQSLRSSDSHTHTPSKLRWSHTPDREWEWEHGMKGGSCRRWWKDADKGAGEKEDKNKSERGKKERQAAGVGGRLTGTGVREKNNGKKILCLNREQLWNSDGQKERRHWLEPQKITAL